MQSSGDDGVTNFVNQPVATASDRQFFGLPAIAATLGVLPATAFARAVALRLFPLPQLPGREWLVRDVKAATYFEVALLILAIPLAAWLYGQAVPRFLAARGHSPWRRQLPGVLFGASFFLWRTGLPAKFALVSGLLLSAVSLLPAKRRAARSTLVIWCVALLGLGFLELFQTTEPLNLFEEGQPLFAAKLLLDGRPPYLGTYPIHGFGIEGGVDAVLFRIAGPSLRAFRLRRTLFGATSLAALGVAGFLLFRDLGWGALAMASSLAFCPVVSDRQAFMFVALCLLIHAARSESLRDWLWAGVASGVCLFMTLDFGVIAIGSGLIAPLGIRILTREGAGRWLRETRSFVLGLAAGCAPFLAYLTLKGAVVEFFRVSFIEIPSTISATWGLPFPSITQALHDGGMGILGGPFAPPGIPSPAVLLAIPCASVLLMMWIRSRGNATPLDRAALVCLLTTLLGLRGVFGRADVGHHMLYGIFAGLMATWLLYRAVTGASSRGLLLVSTCLIFWLFLRPDLGLAKQLELVARTTGASDRGDGAGGSAGSRIAGESVPELAELRNVVDARLGPKETFFDFGNEPALYFLLNRRPPIRYSSVAAYELDRQQSEVIQALEREKPPLAITSSGTSLDSIDDVPNAVRAPAVARYLETHYRPLGMVGTRSIAVRSAP